ncbi:DUF4129 domain-containing protein [Micromonospora sp. PLK6-60]|uniref:DUF4129 domain-containing protein n=1 Tax=Micromonospora sp. PLK6-60 TaxID=2873383 RepID=UPI001CA637C6|nr:DUF4129 domain-containing protein [Micromonospora sp. PLK6-60]MBY8872113.1 DUF4129 domain-containing protein [Micromonospora sp. PLK6-60]
MADETQTPPPDRRRRSVRGLVRRWWPIALVAGLLALAAAASAHSDPRLSRVPPAADTIPYVPDYPTGEPPSPLPVDLREAGEATQAHVPQWISTVALALLGAAILLAVGYVGWAVLRGVIRRTTRAVPAGRARRTAQGTAQEVVAALDAGLEELDDRTTDPRTAVIACWVRLEEAATEAGVPRLTGDTPTDLVTRLLRGDPDAGVPAIASADVLAEFAHVYREARYATHAVDERTRDQARAALRRLRGELTVAAGEPGP